MNNEINRQLIIACELGNLDKVERLLLEGADINFRWDVHTYNKKDILPEHIQMIPGGILQEVQGAGNVNTITGYMYQSDRICPLDIALGYIGNNHFTGPNFDLLKILITYRADIENAHQFSHYSIEDLDMIKKIVMAKELSEKLASDLHTKKSSHHKTKI